MKEYNSKITEYISKEWISKYPSYRSFALDHGIEEKTVRRIQNDKSYNITLLTLSRICDAKGLKLSEFFSKVGL